MCRTSAKPPLPAWPERAGLKTSRVGWTAEAGQQRLLLEQNERNPFALYNLARLLTCEESHQALQVCVLSPPRCDLCFSAWLRLPPSPNLGALPGHKPDYDTFCLP